MVKLKRNPQKVTSRFESSFCELENRLYKERNQEKNLLQWISNEEKTGSDEDLQDDKNYKAVCTIKLEQEFDHSTILTYAVCSNLMMHKSTMTFFHSKDKNEIKRCSQREFAILKSTKLLSIYKDCFGKATRYQQKKKDQKNLYAGFLFFFFIIPSQVKLNQRENSRSPKCKKELLSLDIMVQDNSVDKYSTVPLRSCAKPCSART